MELAFPWPTTNGEWLAWTAAALTALWGLVHLIAPRLALRAAGLSPCPTGRRRSPMRAGRWRVFTSASGSRPCCSPSPFCI
jgi:hypothetical protein